jgi:uncharacterized membrane protein
MAVEQQVAINKSINKLRTASMVIAGLGIVDALYLTWMKLSNNQAMCVQGLGDCWTVNTSQYSEIYGIPIALFGAVGYLIIFGLLWSESKWPSRASNLVLLEFGTTLVGVLFSAYLTYLELAVIKAICPFCLLSATAMLSLFILSIIRLMESPVETNSM